MERIPYERNPDIIAERTSRQAVDPVRLYLDQVGQTPRLNPNEQFDVAVRVKAGQQARAQLEAIQQLSDPEREALGLDPLLQYLHAEAADGEIAREHMIKANLLLVVSIAKKYQRANGHLELLDLIQEGSVGLFRAVDLFDPHRGFQFSTYATGWIRQSITRAISKIGGEIHIPIQVDADSTLVENYETEQLNSTGRRPTADETCRDLGIDAERLNLAHQGIRLKNVSRLDKPIGSGDLSLTDMIADEKTTAAYRLSETKVALLDIINGMAASGALSEKELLFIDMHYYKEQTIKEMADLFGITIQAVRQKEQKILRKLRGKIRGSKSVIYPDVPEDTRTTRVTQRDRLDVAALEEVRQEFAG